MFSLDLLSQAALLSSLLLLLTLLWVRQRSAAAKEPRTDALDTVAAWPPQAVRVMTLPERKALELLRQALPRNHLVLAQVPLSRFISVPTRHPHNEWLRRVGRLSADLLVCDASSRVIGVVEVRAGDETPRSRTRHERLTRVLQAAGIAVHVWAQDALPTAAQVRALFLAKGADDEELQVDTTGRAVLPLPDIEELLAEGDQFVHGHDPVPSGFFEELDAVGSSARR